MLARFDRLLLSCSEPAVIVLALATLALIGVLDYLTGYQISFALFYLIPVGISAWYVGRQAGCWFSLGSSLVWYAAELAYPYHHWVIPIWNAFVRFNFFLIISLLLSALHNRLAVERRLAKTDALTGIMNSRAFTEQLEHDLAIADRAGSPLTLAYFDLDDFKKINDTFGHSAGDRLLRTIGQTLTEGTRRTDSVARLGGDEFALILPATDLQGAETRISQIQQRLSESALPDAQPVTWSIGAIVFRERPNSVDEAIAAADRLMYDAKNHGKNAVVFGVYSRSKVQNVQSDAAEKTRQPPVGTREN